MLAKLWPISLKEGFYSMKQKVWTLAICSISNPKVTKPIEVVDTRNTSELMYF